MPALINKTIESMILLIISLIKNGNPTQALKHCQNLISDGTKNALIYFFAGRCHLTLGNHNEAFTLFAQSLALDLSMKYADDAHHALGVQAYRQAMAKSKSPNIYHLQQAINHFKRALEHCQSKPRGPHLVRLADCWALVGNLERAADYYAEAI